MCQKNDNDDLWRLLKLEYFGLGVLIFLSTVYSLLVFFWKSLCYIENSLDNLVKYRKRQWQDRNPAPTELVPSSITWWYWPWRVLYCAAAVCRLWDDGVVRSRMTAGLSFRSSPPASVTSIVIQHKICGRSYTHFRIHGPQSRACDSVNSDWTEHAKASVQLPKLCRLSTRSPAVAERSRDVACSYWLL